VTDKLADIRSNSLPEEWFKLIHAVAPISSDDKTKMIAE
jgi:hypothetical protein